MSYHDLTGETRGKPASEPVVRQIRQSPAGDPGGGPVRTGSSLRGKFLGALVAIAAVAGFAGIAWYATNQGQKNSATVVPVIQADGSPVKVLPDKPGGMKVPNQDKLIYLQISPDSKKPDKERMLPETEKPMAKPKPTEAEKAPKAAAGSKATEVTQAPIEPPKMEAPEAQGKNAKAVEDAKTKVEETAKKGAEEKKPALDRDALTAAAAAAAKGGLEEGAKEAVGPASGQVAKLAPAEEAKDAIAASGGYRVQLGSSKLKDRAEAEAKRLNKLYASILGDAKVAAVRADLGERGVYYRLWAGPFAERGAADALCDKLKARKQGCLTIKR